MAPYTHTWIKKEIESISKHIATLNDDYTKVTERVGKIETDLDWVKKFQWLILAGVLATVVKVWFGT